MIAYVILIILIIISCTGKKKFTGGNAIYKQNTLDPLIQITEVIHNQTKFKVVRDDLLPGGTKQRGLDYLINIPEKEIIYAGPWNGYAQVALALAAKQFGKRFTMFSTRNDYYTSLATIKYGGKIIVYQGNLKQLQIRAEKYANKHQAYLMKFGMNEDAFTNCLTQNLIQAVKGQLDREHPYTFWLVGGSATLINVLYKVFPKANFQLVQVGKTIWPDQIQPNTRLWVAPEKFYDEAIYQPPYPSARTYDAKLWQFVQQWGSEGDIIWNVGA